MGAIPSSNGSARLPVGLIGTGLFGTALAERLLAEGFPVRVYNRTREKLRPLLARGAKWSDNPLKECRRIIFSVYTTEQVEQVLETMQTGLEPGQIILDTSTSAPEQTTALGGRLARRGIQFLEAPFSGSSEQTRNHQSTALVAGEHTAYEACVDLWECLAARTFYVGAWGNAAKMKLVTNLVLGLNRAVLAEGLVFAEAIGPFAGRSVASVAKQPSVFAHDGRKGPQNGPRRFQAGGPSFAAH